MNLTILSPEQEIFAGPVKSVQVPGISGKFQLLDHHAPIVSALTAGEVRVEKADGQRMNLRITKGFIECLNNEVSLLVSGVQE